MTPHPSSVPRASVLSVIVATSVAATPAQAEFKYDMASGGEVVLYGQLNPAFQMVDDSVNQYQTVADSGHSPSRVGLWYRQPTEAGRFSFQFETSLGFRTTGLISQNFRPDAWNFDRTSLRIVDLSLATNSIGTFSLGQGSIASDGAAETDLSGTTLVTYASIGDSAGGFQFNAGGALTPRIIAAVTPDFDGGRRARIRYDTPEINVFTVSASYGEEILIQNVDLNVADIALRYATDAGPARIPGALAYKQVEPAAGLTDRKSVV